MPPLIPPAARRSDAHTLREACAKANQSHVFDVGPACMPLLSK